MNPRSGSRWVRSGVGTQMMIASLSESRLLSEVKARSFLAMEAAIRSEEMVVMGERPA